MIEQRLGFVFLAALVLATRVEPQEPRAVVTGGPPVTVSVLSQIDGPRCPKFNAEGKQLLVEIALQADGGDWIYDCEYE